MDKHSATVIIPTYNRLQELKLTLDSLVFQKCCYPFEVIVADDGSSDNTKAVIDSYIGKLNIKYVFHEDKGFRAGVARNMGISLAKGEVCIFVDNGVVLHSKAIESHIKTHKKEVNPCLVIGYVHGFEVERDKVKELQEIVKNHNPDEAIEILRRIGILDVREDYYQVLGEDLSKWLAPFSICWSCNISVTTDAVRQYGMFDENFVGWGAEDLDIGMTMFRNNVKYILCRNASSIHYPHEKSHIFSLEPTKIGKLNGQQLRDLIQYRKKQQYMVKKHGIPEVEIWAEVGHPVELENLLVNKRGCGNGKA